jgi:hypothetical protein
MFRCQPYVLLTLVCIESSAVREENIIAGNGEGNTDVVACTTGHSWTNRGEGFSPRLIPEHGILEGMLPIGTHT